MLKVNNMLRFFMLAVMCVLSSCSGADMSSAQIERESSDKIINFITTWYKTGPIKVITTGNFFDLHEPSATFGVWVADFTPETMEGGRALAVKMVNDLWAFIQKTPECLRLYEHNIKGVPRFYWGKMGLKDLCVRIAFWDKDTNRPMAPKLAEITFFNEKFHYYQADPKTLALKLIGEETLEQAVAKVKSG